MSMTAIRGIVEGGKVVLRDDETLAENTEVIVIVSQSETMSRPALLMSPRLTTPGEAESFRKQVIDDAII